MNEFNPENNYPEDIEATEDELKSVGYTAVSLVAILALLISCVLYFVT